MEYQTNPVKAIREKCLECSCGQTNEVRDCPCEDCALWPFRLGKNPFRKKREMSDEEKERMRERMAQVRAQRDT